MKLLNTAILSVAFLIFATTAHGHVSVKPSEVGIGTSQTFSVAVPNEKDNPTVGIRIVIPQGLENVTPNVKTGWNVTTEYANLDNAKKTDDPIVVGLNWTGGSIPSGQRDEFFFIAKVPTRASTLIWKAYQTYQDGTVVAWDVEQENHDSEHESEAGDISEKGPYSTTVVIDDLSEENAAKQNTVKQVAQNNSAMYISIAAFLLSVGAFAMQWMKR